MLVKILHKSLSKTGVHIPNLPQAYTALLISLHTHAWEIAREITPISLTRIAELFYRSDHEIPFVLQK